ASELTTRLVGSEMCISDRAVPQAGPVAAAPNWTFAPQINLTVQGNVHEPQRLADELLPYLQRMLVDFADERQRRSLYDPAMV
ncbi:phage tail tape measure protein, partial [Pseudomonas aeruginosa]|nr:phage tail tape measure protein [Pseudomonas aeruginosa]